MRALWEISWEMWMHRNHIFHSATHPWRLAVLDAIDTEITQEWESYDSSLYFPAGQRFSPATCRSCTLTTPPRRSASEQHERAANLITSLKLGSSARGWPLCYNHPRSSLGYRTESTGTLVLIYTIYAIGSQRTGVYPQLNLRRASLHCSVDAQTGGACTTMYHLMK
jgi:hypothetical protein